jgi:hypothetical protein
VAFVCFVCFVALVPAPKALAWFYVVSSCRRVVVQRAAPSEAPGDKRLPVEP